MTPSRSTSRAPPSRRHAAPATDREVEPTPPRPSDLRLRSRAFWIAAGYAVFAGLWILLSDRALGLLVDDPRQIVEWSVAKGAAFVAVTAALLWLLLRRAFGALERAFASLEATTQRLSASEERLTASNQTLESRVEERTLELAAAVERAEAADRLKSAFLAAMSHELRTPLNSILGFVGILLQELPGPLNAEQAKQLGIVRNSARHLLDLINDVLDLSKIEAGQLEVRREEFSPIESVERVVATVRPLAQAKGLALALDVGELPRRVASDRRRVEQILLNLLNNAIKFTDSGEVRLAAETLAEWRPAAGAAPVPAVRFRVVDTGVGIREEDLCRLFQPFVQLDTGLTRQYDGTGLGLAICRRLAVLLGGEVAAASAPGKGSEFTVVLPAGGPR